MTSNEVPNSQRLCYITDGRCRWERASTSAIINHWKMSRSKRVRAKWPVEFKRDFNIITHELSLLFSLVSPSLLESSNWSIKSLYKKSSNEILGSSRQVSKQVRQRSRTSRPVHNQPVKYDWYERINKAAITTLLSTQEGEGKGTLSNKLFLTTARCNPHE